MSKSKFNLNNLPDLKIRVNNAEESYRAQCAFFELGGMWCDSDDTKMPRYLKKRFLFFYGYAILHADQSAYFKRHKNTEITLPELEALAAEKRLQSEIAKENSTFNDGSSSDEKVKKIQGIIGGCTADDFKEWANEISNAAIKSCPLEMGNMPSNTPPTVVTYMKVQAYAEGDCDNCGCSVALKVDATKEAQKRYDAAVKWLEENADPIVDSEYEDIKCYFDTNSDVLQALRIASGLEPIQSQDNHNP